MHNYMRISELSKRSGVPISKIRYYIQQGVLPKPIKVKATSAYYNDQHLERLNLVVKLTRAKNPTTMLLKELIDSASQIEGGEEGKQPDGNEIMRDKIVYASIPIFRRKGVAGTTITQIAEAAGISPNTFYQAFENKQELFIECLHRIFLDWRKEAPPEGTVPIKTLIKRMFFSFYKAYPEWIHMLNLFRAAASRQPEIFADKLEKSLTVRIKPIAEDIRKGIEQGIFREVDPELAGVMVAGITEYVSYYIVRGKYKEPQEVIEQSMDIFFEGLTNRSHVDETGQYDRRISSGLSDHSETTVDQSE
jgi:AcrR family transcriptional regulator